MVLGSVVPSYVQLVILLYIENELELNNINSFSFSD